MLQTGAVSGTVRDALGTPLGSAEITAYKATYQTGRRVLTKMQVALFKNQQEYAKHVAAAHPKAATTLGLYDDKGVLGQGDVGLGVADPLLRFVLAELDGDAFEVVKSAEAVLDGEPLKEEVREVDERIAAVGKA